MNRATKLPERLGPIHFIGIGGIGMSGIAELLLNLGYTVQGSDLADTSITRRLVRLGARVFEGHSADNVLGTSVVVVSTAIKRTNSELRNARRLGLPVVRRAEMLAELMRLKSNIAVAGTHGKTTTTTMVATLLEHGDFDPTVINGGIIHAFGSNARLGTGEWMVVEADESDGTFLKLPATIAVLTNIDPEHMDHYGSFQEVRDAFDSFVSNVPFYGFAICCVDHPEVQALVGRVSDRRMITYGFSKQADVRVSNLHFENGHSVFDVDFRKNGCFLDACRLPMPGEHNVSNAVAAIAAAKQLGMKDFEIKEALTGFKGVNRRFTHVGTTRGITIIDDYGHHPVEIKAVLKAARQVSKGRVVAVHQPHRYTRLHSLFGDFCRCFNDADVVGIAEVYAAGEPPIPGIDRDSLVRGLRHCGHKNVSAIPDQKFLGEFVSKQTREGDMVVCLGAGNITQWAYSLFQDLSGHANE